MMGSHAGGYPSFCLNVELAPLGTSISPGFPFCLLGPGGCGHCGLWAASLSRLLSLSPSTLPPPAELHLEGNFLHRLPNEVSTLQHLKAIDLSRNHFHDFPEQLTTLPALETINLEENEIVGECTQPAWPLTTVCLQILPLSSPS